MEYREYENVIYRGKRLPRFTHTDMSEAIINGRWQPVAGRQALDASLYGIKMTEEQAREFQGDGWPEEAEEASPTA